MLPILFGKKAPLRLLLRRIRRRRLPLLRGIEHLLHLIRGIAAVLLQLARRIPKDESETASDRFDLHGTNEFEPPEVSGRKLDSAVRLET